MKLKKLKKQVTKELSEATEEGYVKGVNIGMGVGALVAMDKHGTLPMQGGACVASELLRVLIDEYQVEIKKPETLKEIFFIYNAHNRTNGRLVMVSDEKDQTPPETRH